MDKYNMYGPQILGPTNRLETEYNKAQRSATGTNRNSLGDISRFHQGKLLDYSSVKRVVDADTFRIEGVMQSIRLEGADAPETSVFDKAKRGGYTVPFRTRVEKFWDREDRNDLFTQFGGNQATEFADEFLREGFYLELGDTDATGSRITARIYNADGVSLAEALIEEGLAITPLPFEKYYDGDKEKVRTMIRAYENGRGIWGEQTVIRPSDYRKQGIFAPNYKDEVANYLQMVSMQKHGMHNNEYAYILADDHTSFTISASAGSSYHYGKALHSTLMRQAGYYNMAATQPVMGVMESTMRLNARLTGRDEREISNFDMGMARMFDTGLNAPGFGMWMNEHLFMPNGWGRVYKDELGALPSFAALAGRILDEGYMYYMNMSPDYVMLGHELSSGIGFNAIDETGRKEGLFETTFGSATELVVASAQSMGLYMAVSQPIEMIKASMNQAYLNSTLIETFSKRSSLTQNAAGNITDQAEQLAHINSVMHDHFTGKGTKTRSIKQASGFSARSLGGVLDGQSHFFGAPIASAATKPGGITSAIMLHAYETQQKGVAFFDYSDNPELRGFQIRSTFTTMLQIQRERGASILDSVFKPFLLDYINPFDPAGAKEVHQDGRVMSFYDLFNDNVNKLISAIRKPPGLELKLSSGFEFYEFEMGDNSPLKFNIQDSKDIYRENGEEVVREIKRVSFDVDRTKLGDVQDAENIKNLYEVKRSQKSTNVNSFEELMVRHTNSHDMYNRKLQKVNDSIVTMTRDVKALETNPNSSRHRLERKRKYLEDLKVQQKALQSIVMQYKGQLEIASEKMMVNMTGVGVAYKMSIAKHTQDLLDVIPLNPFKWGMLGKRMTNRDEAFMIGQLFSFHKTAEAIKEALTGENVLTRILNSSQDMVHGYDKRIASLTSTVSQIKAEMNALDPSDNDYDTKKAEKEKSIKSLREEIAKQQRLFTRVTDNVVSRVKSMDNAAGAAIDYINDQINTTRKVGRLVNTVEKAFGKFEQNVVKHGKFSLVNVVDGKQTKDVAGNVLKTFSTSGDARLTMDVASDHIDDVMDSLLRANASYQQAMAKAAGTGIDTHLLARAAESTTTVNVAETVNRVRSGMSKNLLAEMGLKKVDNFIGLMVFTSVALNSVMQSTGGASLLATAGALIAGESYDIAIEAQANRILPIAEVTNQMFGWDPTFVNLVVETGTIGAAVAVGRTIAKSQNKLGYLVQHYDTKLMKEATASAKNVLYEFVDEFDEKTGKLTKSILKEISVDEALTSKTGIVFMGKAGRTAAQGTDGLMRFTVLGDGTFKTDAFLREVSEGMLLKSMTYGTVALLALGGARSTIAEALNAMSTNPGWATGIATTAGMAAGGFALGAVLQVVAERGRLPSAVATQGADTGASLMSQAVRKGVGKVNPFLTAAVLGAAGIGIGLYRMTKKGIFEDTKGGSLDPLIGGLMGGFIAGVLTKSAAGALIGATVAGLTASTLNWAGIKFSKTGSRGVVNDINALREVSQLGYFSSAVLQDDKYRSVETLAAAAFAGQYSKGKSIISKEFNDVGHDVITVAHQSPLPFLQFFVAQRVKGKGKHGEGFANPTAGEGTETAYSLGVQTGPLFGTSIAVELPIMYTPKKGFFGLTYNPDSNLLGFYEMTANVGVWAGIVLGGAQVFTNVYGHMLKGAAGMMGRTSQTANFLLDTSKELGKTNRMVFNAVSKVNQIATTSLLRIATGLWGKDAALLYQAASANSKYSESVIELALKIRNNTELDKLVSRGQISSSFADEVRVARKKAMGSKGIQEGLETLTDSGQMDGNIAHRALWHSRVATGSKFFMGAMIGAAVGWAATAAYQTWKESSSKEQQDIESQVTAWEEGANTRIVAAMVTGSVVGMAAGVTNMVRVVNIDEKSLVAIDFGNTLRFVDKDTLGGKLMYSPIAAHKVAQNALKGLARHSKLMKFGATVMTAAALFATQFMRIDSDFGLVKYMDSHMLYKDAGKGLDPMVGDDGRLSYTKNRIHQALVAGGLTAMYGIPIAYAASPLRTNREMLISFASDINTVDNLKSAKNIVVRAMNVITPDAIRNLRTGPRNDIVLQSIEHLNQRAHKFINRTSQANELLSMEDIQKQVKKGVMSKDDVRFAKLLHEFGIEDLQQFQAAYTKVRNGRPGEFINEEEIVNRVTKKIHDMALSSKTKDRYMMGIFNKSMKGRGLRQFGTKVAGALIAIQAVKMLGRSIGDQGGMKDGPTGMNTYLDRLFAQAAKHGMIGQKNHKGGTVGLWEGRRMVIMDVARVFLGRDRVDLTLLDHFNRTKQHKSEKLFEAPVVTGYKEFKQGMRDLSTLTDMLVVDKSNAYMANIALDTGGKTLRRGERGVYTSTYFQLQGAGHDVSTAAYSMSTKWIFKDYVAGRGHSSRIIDRAVGMFQRGEIDVDKAGELIRNVTSQSHALKQSRSFSRMSDETRAAISGDSLLTSIIRGREAAIEHIAWQPVDSLFTNMFYEATDKAKRQLDGNMFVKFLEGVAKGDFGLHNDKNFDFMQMYADLMQEGSFQNYLQNSFIKNVVFFGGGTRNKSRNQQQVQAYAELWVDQTSLSMEMESFKQSRPLIDEFFQEAIIDDIVSPITTTGILTFMPKPMLAIASGAFLFGLSAWGIRNLARNFKVKTFQEGVQETARFYGDEAAFRRQYRADKGNVFSVPADTRTTLSGMSADDWAARSRADREFIAESLGFKPASVTKQRQKGLNPFRGSSLERYTLTVDNGQKTMQFAMSSQIDNITEIIGKKGNNTVIDSFLNMVEGYGSSMKAMNIIVDSISGGPINLFRAAGIRGTPGGDTEAAKILTKLGQLVTDGTGVSPTKTMNLALAGQAEGTRQALTDKFKAVIKDRITGPKGAGGQGIMDAFLDNIYNEDYLLKEIMLKDGRTTTLFHLMSDTVDDMSTLPSGIKLTNFDGADTAKAAAQKALATLKSQQKEWMEQIVHNILMDELSDGSAFARSLGSSGFNSMNLEQHIEAVMIRIMTRLKDDDNMKALLTTNGGVLKAGDVVGETAKLHRIEQMADRTARNMAKDLMENVATGGADALHYGKFARIGVDDALKGTFGRAAWAFGFMSDSMMGLDYMGAYLRAGEANISPFATSYDRELAYQELGRATLTSAVGLLQTFVGGKLLKGGFGLLGNMAKHWKKWMMGAGALTVGTLAGGKNVAVPLMQKTGDMISNSEAMKNAGKWLGNNMGNFETMLGRAQYAPTRIAANAAASVAENMGYDPEPVRMNTHKLMSGGIAAAGAAGLTTGGLLMGGQSLIGAANLLGVAKIGVSAKTGTALIGGITAIAGAKVIAAVLVGAFVVGGTLALVDHEKFTNMSTAAIREVKNLPVIGQWIGGSMTDPYRTARNAASREFYAMLEGSPFQLGFIGDIVNREWMRVVSAADDASGGDMVGVLFGNVLDTSTQLNPAWRQNVVSGGLIGGPAPLLDEKLTRELQIRAQRYSDDVIGNYGWTEIRKFADNSIRVEEAEANVRRYKATQRELYRANLMAAALKGANTSQANSKTINNMQEANAHLDKAILRAKHDQKHEGYEVTAATVGLNQSSVTNSDESLAQQVLNQATGTPGQKIIYDTEFKGQVGLGDDNSVFVNVSREASDKNDLLLAHMYGLTGGVTDNTPNNAQVTHELIGYETLMPLVNS